MSEKENRNAAKAAQKAAKAEEKAAKKAAKAAEREAEKRAEKKAKEAKAKAKAADKAEKKRIKALPKDQRKEAMRAYKEKKRMEKDRWFTWRGIRKEAKRVQWPSWKTTSEKGPGIWQNTGEVVLFTAFFALFFVLINWGVAELLSYIGIGV